MAERPSVKDILARARAAGPAAQAGGAPAPAAPEPEVVEAATPEEEEPVAEAAVEEPAAPTAPTASSLGRPLTLQEKLAAARAAGVPKPAAAPKPAAKPAAAKPTAKAAPKPPAEAEPAAPEAAPSAPPPPAAPIPTGRPLTLQEKLAAARSGAAAPGAAAPAAKPAAAKAAPAAAAKAGAPRELPPLEKITDPKDLAEASRRFGAKWAAAKTAPSPAKPTHKAEAKPQKVPPKPSKEAALTPAQAERRRFLINVSIGTWVALGWATFTAGIAAMLAACGRFMFPNVLAEPPSTIKIGPPANFEPEEVNERWKSEWGFWVVRSSKYNGQDIIYALQSICTHLGCPPNWLAGEQKFKCPCHGSGFYISGINFEGPAPRPLERFKVALADDGQIVVDKSQKFQEELGQWADPDSFIPV
jgi:cytochrome b6-f complex iron-sulfur subunit